MKEFVMGASLVMEDGITAPMQEMTRATQEFQETVEGTDGSLGGMGDAANQAGANARQMAGEVEGATSRVEKMNQAFTNAGKQMTSAGESMTAFATTPLVGLGVGFIKAASDAEEMRGKFSVVFDGMETDMRDFAATSAEAWGRSQIDIEGYLAETQNMLVGMGMVREAGADMSKDIVQLGVDLASFNNMAEGDALRNLQSAISGNHSAAQSLGAVLNENTLAVEMERMGLQGKFQDLDEATKMEVRYASILSQSTDAVGDAVRTSDSFANQMRRLWGGIKDASAEMGNHLLPMATQVVNVLGKAVTWFGNLDGGMQKTILIIGAVVAAIGPVLMVMGMMATAIGAVGLPVIGVIAGIAAFIAILTTLYMNSERAKNIMNTAFSAIVAAGKWLWEQLVTGFNWLMEIIPPLIDRITTGIVAAFDWLMITVVPIVMGIIDDIVQAFTAVAAWFTQYGDKIQTVVSVAWAGISAYVSTYLNFIKNFIVNGFNFILGAVQAVWTMISGIIQAAWSLISGIISIGLSLLTGDWEGAWNAMLDMLGGVWDGISTFFSGLGDLFFESGKMIINTLVDGIKAVAMAPFNAVKGVFDKVRELLPFSDAKDGPLSDLTYSGGAIMTTLAEGVGKEASSLHNAMEGAFNDAPGMGSSSIRPGQANPAGGVGSSGGSGKTVNIKSLVERLVIEGSDKDPQQLAQEILAIIYDLLKTADDVEGGDMGALL